MRSGGGTLSGHRHGGDRYRYPDCVDFSANVNPYGTPVGVIQAICQAAGKVSEYPSAACEELKAGIAAYEETDPSTVICGNGAADLIYLLARAEAGTGAGIGLVSDPTFAEYELAMQAAGMKVRHFVRTADQDFILDSSFPESLSPDVGLVFLCNPSNPDGRLIDPGLMWRILQVCRDNRIRLVVDECFLDFVKNPAEHSLKSFLSACPNLFLLKAFTKAYGMAGVRLGYGLCSDSGLLRRMEEKTQPWAVSSLAQAAGLAALKERDFLEKGRRTVFEEKEYLAEALKQMGFRVFPSDANYLLFYGVEDLREKLLPRGFLIRDCSNIRGLSKGYYRTAVRLHEENTALIEAMQKAAASQSDSITVP